MDYIVIIDKNSKAYYKFEKSIEDDINGKYFWSDSAIYKNAKISDKIYFLVLEEENLKIAKTEIDSKLNLTEKDELYEKLKERWKLEEENNKDKEYLLKKVIRLKRTFFHSLNNKELLEKFKNFLKEITKFEKKEDILIYGNYVSIPLVPKKVKKLINELELNRNYREEEDSIESIKDFIIDFIKNFIISKENLEAIIEIIELLEFQKQIILQGPPGTGKTYLAKLAAKFITKDDNIKVVQFHPSYTYEDFIRGIKVTIKNSQPVYETTNKIFAKICKEAEENPKNKYILIIDEINRANIPVVFGELIYALEYRDEKIETPYDINNDGSLKVPENLYIIGTMNTADRSIGQLDYAIRRRFAFIHIPPNKELIIKEKAKELYEKLVENLFVSENISPEFKSMIGDIKIGHSYFLTKNDQWEKELAIKIIYQVLPILKEYEKDGIILEGKVKKHIRNIFGKENINKEDIENFLNQGNQDEGIQKVAN